MPAVPRPWTYQKVLDAVVDLVGVAPTAMADGIATFERGQLHSELALWKDRWDLSTFGWAVVTYDAALRKPMEDYGGLGQRIEHPPPAGLVNPTNVPEQACLPWPSGGGSLPAEVVASFTRYGRASLGFVRDRRDLGRLFLAETHVRRDGVWAFLPTGTLPARVAEALLLARHAGDRELEAAAVAKLRVHAEDPDPHHPDVRFRHVVAQWAGQYGKASGVDLSDLRGLTWKRPVFPDVPGVAG
jgi:hypothetical protein